MARYAMPNPKDAKVSNDRLFIALATFVAWTAVTLDGAKLLLPGERSLVDVVTHGLAWQILLACVVLVAVILWQRWRDLGLRVPEQGRSSFCSFPS